MHKATEKDMVDIIDKFIYYGGDPTIKNKSGFTCLHIAAREASLRSLKLLVDNSGQVAIRHTWARPARFKVIEYLVAHDAPINAITLPESDSGWGWNSNNGVQTALNAPQIARDDEFIRFSVALGANPSILPQNDEIITEFPYKGEESEVC